MCCFYLKVDIKEGKITVNRFIFAWSIFHENPCHDIFCGIMNMCWRVFIYVVYVTDETFRGLKNSWCNRFKEKSEKLKRHEYNGFTVIKKICQLFNIRNCLLFFSLLRNDVIVRSCRVPYIQINYLPFFLFVSYSKKFTRQCCHKKLTVESF